VPPVVGHYKPLHLVFWWGSYRVFGLHPAGYHALSIALHLANVALLWYVALRLTGRALVAHIAALVLAMHPALTFAVVWISATTDLAPVFLGLLSIVCFIRWRDAPGASKGWLVASVVAYALALLMHPKVAPIVLGIAVYEGQRSLDEGGRIDLRRFAILIPYALVLVPYAGVQLYARAHIEAYDGYAFGSAAAKNFLRYVAMAVYPRWSIILEPTGVARNLDENVNALIIGGVAILWMVALAALVDGKARVLVASVSAWFLISLVPLTTFEPGAVSHELYAAMPAFAILLGLFAAWLVDATARVPLAGPALALALVVALAMSSARTTSKERDFNDSASRWETWLHGLQAAQPRIPPGTKLYVVNPPIDLAAFGDSFLKSLVATYYPGVDATAVSSERAEQERQRGPGVAIYDPSHPAPSPAGGR
jgi:hypothetical protein